MPLRRTLFRSGALALLALSGTALGQDAGLVTQPSRHDAAETARRFAAAVRDAGWVVFTEIDHAAAARAANLALPTRTVIIFGNPVTGTPAMAGQPTLALDLPMRVLVWDDAAGRTHLTRSTGQDIAGRVFARHGIAMPAPAQAGLEAALAGFARRATE
jgi:uncharacterized protein (DUF302 family)